MGKVAIEIVVTFVTILSINQLGGLLSYRYGCYCVQGYACPSKDVRRRPGNSFDWRYTV